jgi:hypothetical protein
VEEGVIEDVVVDVVVGGVDWVGGMEVASG